MFCAECGTKNDDSARYCENCGALLVSNEVVSDGIQDSMLPMQDEVISSNAAMPGMHIKFSKWSAAVILEVIVLAVLAYGVKWIGSKYYSAEYIAESYFEVIMEGDLGEAYEFLEVKESDFISKELFKKTYNPEGRGKLGSYSVKEERKDGVSATVKVTYRVLNESEERVKEIVLIKKSDKKFFIFDHWKVNPGEDIVADVSICAPQNAAVSLDGISLGEEYKKSKENGYDIYQISEMFCGKHVINAAKEDTQPVEKNVVFYSNTEEENVVWLPQMHLEKKVLQRIAENSKSVFKSIMDAKVKDTNASFIDSLVVDSEGAEFTKRRYENFFTAAGSYLRLKDIQVRAIDIGEDSDYDFNSFTSEGSVVEAGVEVDASCIYQAGYGYEEEREISAMFCYGHIDGKLGLLAVELESGW